MKCDLWAFFEKSVEKVQVSLKSEKNNGFLTWRPKYTYDIWATSYNLVLIVFLRQEWLDECASISRCLSIRILRNTLLSTSFSLTTRPLWTLDLCTELWQLRKHPLLLRYENKECVADIYPQKYAVADWKWYIGPEVSMMYILGIRLRPPALNFGRWIKDGGCKHTSTRIVTVSTDKYIYRLVHAQCATELSKLISHLTSSQWLMMAIIHLNRPRSDSKAMPRQTCPVGKSRRLGKLKTAGLSRCFIYSYQL
jgi:hypothetical protein